MQTIIKVHMYEVIESKCAGVHFKQKYFLKTNTCDTNYNVLLFYLVQTIRKFFGVPIAVRSDEQLIIDCGLLIDEVRNSNPNVTWYNDGVAITNGSHMNVFISADDRYCIITDTSSTVSGQMGTAGSYTCEVCTTTGCINETNTTIPIGDGGNIRFCGELDLLLKFY